MRDKKDIGSVEFVIYPNKILSTPAETINFEVDSQEDIMVIVRKMAKALAEANYGQKLGLAAPQIGINKRVAIVQNMVMINPVWEPVKGQTIESIEGCYSVPGKMFTVTRPKYGWATWRSVDGAFRKAKLTGLDAIVFQHELDHLDGKCCIDVGKPWQPSRTAIQPITSNSKPENNMAKKVTKKVAPKKAAKKSSKKSK